jgi:hypothetical protein
MGVCFVQAKSTLNTSHYASKKKIYIFIKPNLYFKQANIIFEKQAN